MQLLMSIDAETTMRIENTVHTAHVEGATLRRSEPAAGLGFVFALI